MDKLRKHLAVRSTCRGERQRHVSIAIIDIYLLAISVGRAGQVVIRQRLLLSVTPTTRQMFYTLFSYLLIVSTYTTMLNKCIIYYYNRNRRNM